MWMRAWSIGCCGLALLAALGCSTESVGLVQGTVTLDDKPLSGAGISFVLSSGNVVAATSDGGGSFQIEVPTGDCKIGVTARSDDEMTGESAKKMTKGAPPPQPKNKIPPHYGDPESSGFKLKVISGVNNYPIALKSK